MTWLAPPDTAFAWLCLMGACLFALPPVRATFSRLVFESSPRSYCLGISVASFVLSLAYVHVYLLGAPRIIDATTYLLQAKTIANGSLTFTPPGPLASFNGRFLLVTPEQNLAGIFPPGYPLILALGVLLGVPMFVNPLIGVGIAVCTYQLGRTWFGESTGRLAGVLSTLCTTLRYHSADTMSHAWCALLILFMLVMLSRLPAQPARGWLAGLAAGWLFATRPLTGAVFVVGGLLLVFRSSPLRSGQVLRFGAGLLPGVVLWVAYNWATTGSLTTPQSEYYARSDFPAGCFRLGFGADIGCRFEHAEFLKEYQPTGYGLAEAFTTTWRRLALHHMDIANLPWVSLFALASVGNLRTIPALGWTWALIGSHIAAYALFYFDGNYPGGGARMYADILPLQHLLLSWVLVRWKVPSLAFVAALAGFGLCSTHLSRHLRERDGGRPMFDSAVVENLKQGIVFVDSDHGFNLAFEPGRSSAAEHWIAARHRGDASDVSLWHAHANPAAYRYTMARGEAEATVELRPYRPTTTVVTLGGHLWPPVDAQHGSVVPTWDGACQLSPGLELVPSGAVQRLSLAVPVPSTGDFIVRVLSDVPPTPLHPSRRLGQTCFETDFGRHRLTAGQWLLSLTNQERVIVGGVTLAPAPLVPTPQ